MLVPNPYEATALASDVTEDAIDAESIEQRSRAVRSKIDRALLITMGSLTVAGIAASMRSEIVANAVIFLSLGTAYLYGLSRLQDYVEERGRRR